MKIGILTFHWATNYGAVLQCYALQTYLEWKGHEVEVINYRPRQYDDTLCSFIRYRKFLNIKEYQNSKQKEAAIEEFRSQRLNRSKRIYTCAEIGEFAGKYDVIISGSDQVMNPSFLASGEGKGVVTPSYFLGFPFKGKRIGYALSFGCVKYPEKEREIASKYINDFDVITVREFTGVDIVKSMGRDDAIVVPDPTLLMDSEFYRNLAQEKIGREGTYVYCFFIRNIAERRESIGRVLDGYHSLWNNDDKDFTMEGWLAKIRDAEFVVTDSFHCMVMCLKMHRPFAVVTELAGNIGMNDRLYTLLGKVKMQNRVIEKGGCNMILELFNEEINWSAVDDELRSLMEIADKILD